MRFQGSWVACWAVSLSCLCQGFVGAEEKSPLAIFPESADIVLRLKAPEVSIDRISALAEKVQPNAGGFLRQQAGAIGALISNPGQVGVDKSRDWYVVVFAEEDEQPGVVFVIPTKDAEAAKKSLPGNMNAIIQGDWLIYHSQDFEIPALDTDEGGETLAQELAEDATAWKEFNQGDLSLWVHLSHLHETYESKIDGFHQQIEALMTQLQNAPHQANGPDMKLVGQIYGPLIKGLFQGFKDAEALTISIQFNETGLQINDYCLFEEDTETSAALGAHHASNFSLLSELPADAVFLAGISADWGSMMEWASALTVAMMKDAESKEKCAKIMSDAKLVKLSQMALGYTVVDGTENIVRAVSIMEVNPVAKLREMMLGMSELSSKIEAPGLKQEVTLKKEAEAYGPNKADITIVKQEFDASLDPTGLQNKLQALMSGKEGMVSRTLYYPDKVLQTMGGGKEAMAAAVKLLEATSSTGADPRRQGLHAEANVLVLVDVPSLASKIMKVVAKLADEGRVPFNAQTVDNLQIKRSFTGWSLLMDDGSVSTRLTVPVSQLQGFAKLGFFAQSLYMQAN